MAGLPSHVYWPCEPWQAVLKSDLTVRPQFEGFWAQIRFLTESLAMTGSVHLFSRLDIGQT
jgi:hypothetical protein